MTAPAEGTPSAIIEDAMLDAGLLQQGEHPNGEQLTKGSRRLRDLINVEQIKGIKLWLNVDTSIPLVSGQSTYVLSPTGDVAMVKPLRVIQAYYLDSSSVRRPLVCLSWDDYIRLSQVTITGAINSYFVNKKQSQLDVFFYLTPDATAATGTAHVLLQTQVTQFTNLTDTMNFPVEWRMFLHWALADELSVGQPESIMTRCAQKAEMYRDILEGWDVEDASTQFQPDARGAFTGNNFT